MAVEMGIRSAFPAWAHYNKAWRDVVGRLTDEQLLLQPTPERWPLWASIGHAACQRVFWLCDFAGAPGADSTRFTDASYNCPGDDDLENVLSSADLVAALDSTFRIIDDLLDRWSFESLDDEIDRPEMGDRLHTRGWVLQRVFAHDVSHIAELNEALGANGLEQVDIW